MLSSKEKENYKRHYEDMNTVELMKEVSDEITMFLNDNQYSDLLERHFISAQELLSRIRVQHSYHNIYGENVLTSSGYNIINVPNAIDALKDMELPDGTVVAQAVLGEYKAARKHPEMILK